MIDIGKLKLIGFLPPSPSFIRVQIDETNMTCRVTADTIPVPSAPSGLTAIDNGAGISLNWNDNPASENVTTYQVSRSLNEGGPFTSLNSAVAVSQYTDSTPTTNTTYFYRITATNIGGVSNYTSISGSFVSDATAPAEVSGISAALTGAHAVTVSWTNPTDIDFAGVNFYRSTTENGTYTKLNTTGLVQDNNFTDPNATAGSTWWYKVTTVDTTGNESTGTKVSKAVPASDTTAPATPSTPVALDIHSSLHVSWTPNTETDLASYSIFRSDDGYTTALATGLPLSPASYDDTSAVLGTSYSYKVLAKDATGNSSSKSLASNTTARTATPVTGSLSNFIRIGRQAPCVAHVRGVDFSKYRGSSDGKTITFTEIADFTALANGTPLTARYEWNMAAGVSEDQGKYATGRGFNYAHAYDIPGNYTIRLTRTDDMGIIKVFESKATILKDTRKVVYCSSNGDTSTTNPGTDKTKPVSIARANSILAASESVKVLLQRGDSFSLNGTAFTLSKPSQMISSDVSFVKAGVNPGTLPILTFTGTTSGDRPVVEVTKTGLEAVVENFIINSTWTTNPTARLADIGVRVTGDVNALIRNIQFKKIGKPLEVDQSGATTRYVLCQDCSCPNDDSMVYNFLFTKGADYVFLGLNVANSLQEHIIRMSQCDRCLIAFCNLTNKELSTSDTVKTCTNFQQGSYCYQYRNTYTADLGTVGSNFAGTIQIGPLNKTTATLEAFCKKCVVEECFINAMIEIEDGASEVMIRNNIITKNESFCFQVYGHGEGVDQYGRSLDTRVNSKIYIYNNTCINNGKNGQIFRVKHSFDSLEFSNNLLIGANMVKSTGSIPNKSMYLSGLGASNLLVRNVVNALNEVLIGSTTYSCAQFNVNGGSNNAMEAVTVIAATGKPTFLTTTINQKLARPIKGVFSSINGTARAQADSTWTPGAYQL